MIDYWYKFYVIILLRLWLSNVLKIIEFFHYNLTYKFYRVQKILLLKALHLSKH